MRVQDGEGWAGNRMKTGRGIDMSWGACMRLLIATTAALGLSACDGMGGGDVPSPDSAGEAYRRVVNVEVERLQTRSFTRVIRLPGVAMAMRDVVVSAEEAGVVRQIVRDKGRPVRAGQGIVRFDDAILRAQVEAAAAQTEYAEEVWERRKKLYEQDSIGSELSYHEALHAAEQSRSNLRALEERLARTTVTAPINGVLDQRLVEIGSMVSPGTPVAHIVQTDTIRIMAGAPERSALELPMGAPATVFFDALPDSVFEGAISHVGAVVDQDSRTFPIELMLPNARGLIKPGMIAEVSVVQEEIEDALVVPQQALVAMEEGYVVFVVEGGGEEARARARIVGVSVSQGNDVVVGSGLSDGDLLVVVGQQGLTAGDRVRVVSSVGDAREGGE